MTPCSWTHNLTLAVLLLALSGCEPAPLGELVPAQVGDVSVRIMIARDAASRRQGLMGRQSLGQDEGLLLVFPKEHKIRLWMLNTSLPLDAGFFDRDGVMVGSVSMKPDGGKRIHSSPAPAVYALEMNRGWFKRNGIRPGARLHLPNKVVGE
ncbi:MAG: DUF192 domain-containing protein [Gammaproteobacteria bacterium]